MAVVHRPAEVMGQARLPAKGPSHEATHVPHLSIPNIPEAGDIAEDPDLVVEEEARGEEGHVVEDVAEEIDG